MRRVTNAGVISEQFWVFHNTLLSGSDESVAAVLLATTQLSTKHIRAMCPQLPEINYCKNYFTVLLLLQFSNKQCARSWMRCRLLPPFGRNLPMWPFYQHRSY